MAGKRVFIIHGWDGKPEHGWYLWLRDELESRGFKVEVPEMPNSEEPEINSWVGKLNEIVGQVDEETYFVGHSVGCQTILRYLQILDESSKIGGAVFVAPWMHLDEETIREEGEEVIEIAKPWMETPIDFEKVKKMSKHYVAIFSDNDYYVPLSDRDIFRELLGAKIITEHDKGHFTEDDGIKDLPVLLNEFLDIYGEQ